jgi:hypothetical protein
VRHTTPSFTVEVRRTSKRATSQKAQAWVTDMKPKISESTRTSYLAANAPFRTKPSQEPGHKTAPPHTGRILPSLIDESPASLELRDSSSSKQEATSTSPRATRLQGASRQAVRTPKPPKNSPYTAEADAKAPDYGAKGQATDNDASTSPIAAALPHPPPNAASPKVRKKENSRKAAPIYSEPDEAVPLSEGQTSTAEPNAKANSPSNVQEDPTPVRKRLITGRYVLGDEFKPGERWKRLLRWKR